MKFVKIPKYSELKVADVWNYVKDIPDIAVFFPDYTKSELPERDYLFNILYTIKPEAIESLVKDARMNRGVTEEQNQDEMVEIDPDIWQEISEIVSIKDRNYLISV